MRDNLKVVFATSSIKIFNLLNKTKIIHISQITLKAISKRQTKKHLRNADYFVIIDLRILLLKFTIKCRKLFQKQL